MIRTATALVLLAAPAWAQEGAGPADARAVFDALRLPEIIAVAAEDGREFGDLLAEQVFGPRSVPAEWDALVADIYDPAHMEAEVLDSLALSLDGQDTAAMLAFLESDAGRSFVDRELAARQLLADEEAEEAAREAAAVALASDDPGLGLLHDYVEANDLLETNVANVMNSNFAYMSGLMDGGAMRGELTESDVLQDIWAQEPTIRAEAAEWLYAFLLEAYRDVPESDLQALIDFSRTEPGQALNAAVFDAFANRYADISRALGLAAARYLTTEAL